MELLTVERTVWIAAPPERVWRAVTDPSQLGRWWQPDAWDIPAFEVGGRVRFGDESDAAYATITAAEPPHGFTFQWDANPKFPVTTMQTTFTLVDADGGTRLHVRESGFESLPDDIRQNRADQTGEGYTLVLADLKAYIERA